MTPHYPPDYGPAAVLCAICGRTLVPRIYNSASVGEYNATCWVCTVCDLIPDSRDGGFS